MFLRDIYLTERAVREAGEFEFAGSHALGSRFKEKNTSCTTAPKHPPAGSAACRLLTTATWSVVRCCCSLGIEPRERHSSAYRAAKDLIQVQVWTCGTEHGTRSSRSSIRDADAELRAVSRSTQTALTRSSPGRSGSRTGVRERFNSGAWSTSPGAAR